MLLWTCLSQGTALPRSLATAGLFEKARRDVKNNKIYTLPGHSPKHGEAKYDARKNRISGI